MENSKRKVFIIMGIIFVLVAAGGYYLYSQNSFKPVSKQHLVFDPALETTDDYISLDKIKNNTKRYYNYHLEKAEKYSIYIDTQDIKEVKNIDDSVILRGKSVSIDNENLNIQVDTYVFYYDKKNPKDIYMKTESSKFYTLDGQYQNSRTWHEEKYLVKPNSVGEGESLDLYYLYYGEEFRPEEEQK